MCLVALIGNRRMYVEIVRLQIFCWLETGNGFVSECKHSNTNRCPSECNVSFLRFENRRLMFYERVGCAVAAILNAIIKSRGSEFYIITSWCMYVCLSPTLGHKFQRTCWWVFPINEILIKKIFVIYSWLRFKRSTIIARFDILWRMLIVSYLTATVSDFGLNGSIPNYCAIFKCSIFQSIKWIPRGTLLYCVWKLHFYNSYKFNIMFLLNFIWLVKMQLKTEFHLCIYCLLFGLMQILALFKQMSQTFFSIIQTVIQFYPHL